MQTNRTKQGNEQMIIQGDCKEVLKTLESESVDTCITSPPYWGLRDYGTADWEGGDPGCNHLKGCRFSDKLGIRDTTKENVIKENNGKGQPFADVCGKCGAKRVDRQLGLEKTPEEYTANMVKVFREVRRVLKKEGTLFLNLGDSYYSSGQHAVSYGIYDDYPTQYLKPKDLVGIPWRVAFALQADGWYLRQDIIWHKPNPMPESVTDRCTKAHEYIFLLSKQGKYYYDHEAIREPIKQTNIGKFGTRRLEGSKTVGEKSSVQLQYNEIKGANKRSVWTVTTKPYKGAHFATFPKKLITPCVLAGCPKGGVVLDPFNGAGTTGVVATENNRKYIGIELNPDYLKMAEQRVKNTQGTLF
jgi:DNA modification methylase